MLLIIASFTVLICAIEFPGFFNKDVVRLFEGFAIGSILFIVFVGVILKRANDKSIEKDISPSDERELQYITAIVRDYPRENLLLGKGAILHLFNIVNKIKPSALEEMHFNSRIAFFLNEQMKKILINEGIFDHLEAVTILLRNASVDEVEGFGTGKYFAPLQQKVIEVCGNCIILAAEKEYRRKCDSMFPSKVLQYLDEIDQVQIFRIMGIKSHLLGIIKFQPLKSFDLSK